MERHHQKSPLRIPLHQRLWVKLAIFGVLGVILTHSIHVVVANRATEQELTKRLLQEGRTLAKLVASQGADAVLIDDRVVLQELVDTVSASADVAYCFVHREEAVLASSFRDGTPTALVGQRHDDTPRVIRSGTKSYLDMAQLMLGGSAGEVHIGMYLDVLEEPRQRLAASLGLIALCVVAGGVLAAFLVGRGVARPVGEMVRALQSLDPSTPPVPLPERRLDEIGLLTRQVNQMRSRLHLAYQEQKRVRRKQMQTEKLAALGSLVAGVAHEVNNPLAGLKNCQQRLRLAGLAPQRREEYLGLMEDGLQRIENVVRQLLDFSRVRPPKHSVESVEVLLTSARSLLAPVIESRKLVIDVDLGEAAECSIKVDAGQIEQALVNLLLNAAFVTDDRGTIRVRTTKVGQLLGIEIQDDGPGIPAKVRSQIEDPFFTTKPEGQGTGLGLSVTRGIVDAHQGDLSFACPAGGGTVVTLWLPLEH